MFVSFQAYTQHAKPFKYSLPSERHIPELVNGSHRHLLGFHQVLHHFQDDAAWDRRGAAKKVEEAMLTFLHDGEAPFSYKHNGKVLCDDGSWSDLDEQLQEFATQLGWNEVTWTEDTFKPTVSW